MQRKIVKVSVIFAISASAIVATALYATSSIKNYISKKIEAFELSMDNKLKNNAECTPISTLPADIQQPGIYCLSGTLENKNEARDSITIFVNGVTIKGNGFCLKGSTTPTATHSGIRAIDRKHVTIQDICIIGHKTGILIGDTKDAYASDFSTFGINSFRDSSFITIKDSSLSRQTFQGIHARGSNIEILRNSIQHIGGVAGENPFATGIYLSAVNCAISQNRVFDLRPAGNGEGVGIGLNAGAGCKVTRNLIDPFRVTDHGRTFGIWSKSSMKDMPYFARNTVINADYAYGPFGYYKDNSAVDSACGLFVDRTFSLSNKDLGGWLSTENNKHIKTPNTRHCRDEINTAIARAQEDLNKYTAYSVALAYGEHDPNKNEAAQLAWLLLAADLDHEEAMRIINSSPTAGRTQEVFDKATSIYHKMNLDKIIASAHTQQRD